jgi:hypothetical protein
MFSSSQSLICILALISARGFGWSTSSYTRLLYGKIDGFVWRLADCVAKYDSIFF